MKNFQITKQIIYFLLLLFPYFYNSWNYAIWDSNEAYYVEGPKEMLESGDFLTPRFNYDYRFEKPILSYWVIIIFYKIFGISVFSERLAIILFAFASIILTFLISQIIFNAIYNSDKGKELAYFSAGIFATSFKFFTLSHRSIIDILLTFWILLALLLYLKFIEKDCKSLILLVGIFASCAFGILTKGLLGIIVPGGIIFLHILFTKRFFLFKDWRIYLAFIFWSAIASLWFIYMAYKHGISYLKFFFLGNHIELYLKGSYSLARPIWYYIPNIAGGFAPWTCFFLFILFFFYYLIKNKVKLNDTSFFILIWIFYIFLFFSLSKGKQEEYVLQIYPALSILLIWALEEAFHFYKHLIKRLTNLTIFFMSFLFLIFGIISLLFNEAIFPQNANLNRFSYLCLFFAIISILFFPGIDLKKLLIVYGVFTWIIYNILIIAYLPLFDKEYKYSKYFAEVYKRIRNSNSSIGYFKVGIPSLCFYANEKVHIFKEVEEIKKAKGKGNLYLIIDEKSFNDLPRDIKEGFRIIDERFQFPTTFKNFMKLLKGYGKEKILLIGFGGK